MDEMTSPLPPCFHSLDTKEAIELWKKGKDAWNNEVKIYPHANICFYEVDFSSHNKENSIVDFNGYKFPSGIVDFQYTQFGNKKIEFCNAEFNGSVNFA
ncbi:hypothetical protein, partial [Zooshikella harenae]